MSHRGAVSPYLILSYLVCYRLPYAGGLVCMMYVYEGASHVMRPAARPRALGAGTVPTPPGRHTYRANTPRTYTARTQYMLYTRVHGGTCWGWWWVL